MRISRRRTLSALAVTFLGLLSGCGDDNISDPQLPSELKPLQQATAAYQEITAAEAAGWDTPITTCWYDHEQGAMGYHYGKVSLIDGTPSLVEPEALIYEPQSDHSMRLVGVEYIVPIDAWTGTAAPSLVGQAFTRNDALGVYALHVWLWKNNPSGLYAPWNPDVTCDYADESEDMNPGASSNVAHHGAL